MDKESYERSVYESVDERCLSLVIPQIEGRENSCSKGLGLEARQACNGRNVLLGDAEKR